MSGAAHVQVAFDVRSADRRSQPYMEPSTRRNQIVDVTGPPPTSVRHSAPETNETNGTVTGTAVDQTMWTSK